MDRKRLGTLLCGAVFCMMAVLVQLTPARAAELADPAQKVSLTIEAQQNGRAVSGMELSLRRVAEMDARGQFALMGSYQSSGVSVDGLTSSSQWNQAAKELNDFAAEESIPADVWTVTEGQGVCTIDGLESGLYLVAAETLENAEGRYDAAPFLVALPMLENEAWNYDPTVLPKIQFTAVPVSPEPSAPVSPEPSSPVNPEPSAPVSPEPSAPVSPEPSAPVSPEPSSPVSPEPSGPVSPEPESSASPSPSGQPAASPTPSPGANEGLPQTGQLNWPIPLLALLGMLLAAAGCLLRRRHE